MSKNKDNDTQLYSILIFVMGVLGYQAWKKILPKLLAWYYDNRFLIAFTLACTITLLFNVMRKKFSQKFNKYIEERNIISPDGEDSVFVGHDDKNHEIHIGLSARKMHTQIVGTTNAGKTESVIIPFSVDDIKRQRGFLLLDGKADESLLSKLYAYAKHFNRHASFKYFSLADIEKSHTFNPLIGGTPEEITERVFNAFIFENEFYRAVQYEIFSQIIRLFASAEEIPTFLKVYQAITNPMLLKELAANCKDELLSTWATQFALTKVEEREKQTAGLTSQLSQFAFGSTAALFNTEAPSIDLNEALKNNDIVYFQLPVLRMPSLGKATGKLVLQCLNAAVSERHKYGLENHKFFSIYLDDFSEFIPKTFISLLNKSRSANVGVTFAHQALGDLKSLGDDIQNTILVNSNLKIFMRTNEPESAEYFAKVAGTTMGQKTTERQTKKMFGHEKTGEASVRTVEEFIYHPNVFKSQLGVGEAVIIIPHKKGAKAIKLQFLPLRDLPNNYLPKVSKAAPAGLANDSQSKKWKTKGTKTLLDKLEKNESKEAAV